MSHKVAARWSLRWSRRLATLLLLTVVAYLATTTAVTMLVLPPTGEATITADQQTALDKAAEADAQRAFSATVASYLAWHHCEPVAVWTHAHPGQIPARMVQHADQSQRLEVVRWTYPAARGEWVDGLCN